MNNINSPATQLNDAPEWLEIRARIQNYLGNGGFFNPEHMEHDKVRNLLMDIRNLIGK